CLQGYTPPYTF
nr:immunoglobulin light chain junction region [Macaca mulatta]